MDQAIVEDLVSEVNQIYFDAGTGIQFYIDEVDFQNNEGYRTGINNFLDMYNLFDNERESGAMNVHLLRSSGFNNSGYAITPYYNKFDIYQSITEGVIWSCYVTTSQSLDEVSVTLAHELGHTLGLLHTHHPGRNFSLISNMRMAQ
ncbi:MAG: M12 family metallo-peptidase [Bacteroidota bacterium]